MPPDAPRKLHADTNVADEFARDRFLPIIRRVLRDSTPLAPDRLQIQARRSGLVPGVSQPPIARCHQRTKSSSGYAARCKTQRHAHCAGHTTSGLGPSHRGLRNSCACRSLHWPDRSVWQAPIQTSLTPAPARSPAVPVSFHQTQDALRSDARSPILPPVRNPESTSCTSRPPLPRPAVPCCCQLSCRRFGASSNDDTGLFETLLGCGRTHSRPCHCSRIPRPTAESRCVAVSAVLPLAVQDAYLQFSTGGVLIIGGMVRRRRSISFGL